MTGTELGRIQLYSIQPTIALCQRFRLKFETAQGYKVNVCFDFMEGIDSVIKLLASDHILHLKTHRNLSTEPKCSIVAFSQLIIVSLWLILSHFRKSCIQKDISNLLLIQI